MSDIPKPTPPEFPTEHTMEAKIKWEMENTKYNNDTNIYRSKLEGVSKIRQEILRTVAVNGNFDIWEAFFNINMSIDNPYAAIRKREVEIGGKENFSFADVVNDFPFRISQEEIHQRPEGWKENEQQCKKVDEALKNEDIKKKIDAAISKVAASNTEMIGQTLGGMVLLKKCGEPIDHSIDQPTDQSSITSDTVPVDQATRCLNVNVESFPSNQRPYLRDSWIFDTGAERHICNNRSRFLTYEPSEEQIYTGDSTTRVMGYGTVWTYMTNSLGKQFKVILKNAANPAEPAKITEPVKISNTSYTPKCSTASSKIWHQRLGHPSMRAVEHLPTDAKGVQISDIKDMAKSNDIEDKELCEPCHLAKAKNQISRRPHIRSKLPFERLHADIVQGPSYCYNGERWLIHFVLRWIKRQFDCETKIIRIDNEKGIKESDTFKDWVIELGLEIEYSSEYIHEQNGAAERAGAIITTRARTLRIESLLPQSLFPEIAIAAVYLLNRTPTKMLGWKSPLRALEEYLHIEQHSCAHLRAYGCRAYAKIPNEILNRNRSQKLDPRAHIGYLVGYDSTNIFRIWIPHLDRVIRARDVIFGGNRRYNPEEPHIEKQLRDWVTQEAEFLDIEVQKPRVGTSQQENNLYSDIDIFRPDEIPPRTENVDKDSEDINKELEAQLMADILPTPDSTPEPDSSNSIELDLPIDTHPILSSNRAPRANEISSDFSESNIIEGKRTRKATHHIAVSLAKDIPNRMINAVFAEPLSRSEPFKIHRSQLPDPPQHWNDVNKHPYRDEWINAAKREWDSITQRNTYEVVSRPSKDTPVIPLCWVFTYKFDDDGYLVKFKARICIRGDLQPVSELDTKAHTLAARTFRILLAIINAFDLDAEQLDGVNAFINSSLDELVYVELPDGWWKLKGVWNLKKNNYVLRLLRALYGLRRSPLLWLKELSTTLKRLGLSRKICRSDGAPFAKADLDWDFFCEVKEFIPCSTFPFSNLWLKELSTTLKRLGFVPIPEDKCLFTNGRIMIFFYVDDTVVVSHPDDREEKDQLIKDLKNTYEFRQMGNLEWFLNMRITRDRSSKKLWLCQDAYIDKMVDTYHLAHARKASTPLSSVPLAPYQGTASPEDSHYYQRRIGSCIYAAVMTRPDIAYAVGKLTTYMTNPSERHSAEIDRVIAYLRDSKNLAIEYSVSDSDGLSMNVVEAACDASFADNSDRRSTEGRQSQFGGTIL
ncbi:predicted protein [Histoplasma mississippiense (nom. inval.)]|uniref:predicted protein n=1 Tax=Ajellomyces capsulatus (strain NAm1 / WU24) TaxID=2059318 RepID=UPI000157D0AE|nr:predicted protein [Histoplasma mississippiense (nom. inval.)]EDN10858.1 predicted protein [Histoplasma mississippiense (nom. inval.)]